jgi:hypothetical protein
MRERKMREGPWTAEKPPRKTPSSQAKGAAGSSGSVKRPHSNSSTPSQEKQPKRPRSTKVQIASFKEAVTGIKMATIQRCDPDESLDHSQTEIIDEKLLTAVDANPAGETPPQFLHSKFAQGVLWITCANESTKIG